MATGAREGPLGNKKQQGHLGEPCTPHVPESFLLSAHVSLTFVKGDSGQGLGIQKPLPCF